MTTAPTVHKDHFHEKSSYMDEEITNHRKIAVQLQAAAKLHLEAARHYASGDLGKATQKVAVAQKHLVLAQNVS